MPVKEIGGEIKKRRRKKNLDSTKWQIEGLRFEISKLRFRYHGNNQEEIVWFCRYWEVLNQYHSNVVERNSNI